jgi:hypothetical protein
MTPRRISIALATALVLTLCRPAPASADLLTIPAGLNPGDHFRVVFISSAKHDALSSAIADYDAFISGLATAAGIDTYFGDPVTWQVLGSTFATSALSRVPLTSAGLYLTNGVKVADSGADLWDGTIDSPILLEEHGFFQDDIVFTGTMKDGTSSQDAPLGGAAILITEVGLSSIVTTDEGWVRAGPVGSNTLRHFYGVSSELTVPDRTVPEPASFSLALVGLAAAGLRRAKARLSTRVTRRGRAQAGQGSPEYAGHRSHDTDIARAVETLRP